MSTTRARAGRSPGELDPGATLSPGDSCAEEPSTAPLACSRDASEPALQNSSTIHVSMVAAGGGGGAAELADRMDWSCGAGGEVAVVLLS